MPDKTVAELSAQLAKHRAEIDVLRAMVKEQQRMLESERGAKPLGSHSSSETQPIIPMHDRRATPQPMSIGQHQHVHSPHVSSMAQRYPPEFYCAASCQVQQIL